MKIRYSHKQTSLGEWGVYRNDELIATFPKEDGAVQYERIMKMVFRVAQSIGEEEAK